MALGESFAAELKAEAATTRKLLERVPQESLAWKPHEKSMALGRLAGHVAELPSMLAAILTLEELDFASGTFKPFIPENTADLLARYDQNIATALELLSQQADEPLFKNWRLRSGDHVLFDMPRIALVRGLALNHWIHHRGQLSVYLRLLDVPVPSIYGPSADDSAGF